jgi:hypothetical protein
VRTGDLNGDGILETILADGDAVAAYDRAGRELWRRRPVEDSAVKAPEGGNAVLSGIELADFNGDGCPEVLALVRRQVPHRPLLGDRMQAVVYDGRGKGFDCTTILEDGIHTEYGSPQGCFDYDGDGQTDIVVAGGHTICVHGYPRGDELLREQFADEAVVAGVGDVNGDGRNELFLLQDFDCHVGRTSDDKEYDSEHCYAVLFDSRRQRLWKQTYQHCLNGSLADLNADGTSEIILISARS